MAITVQHGNVSDVARLGQLAGEAAAARTEEARQDRLMEVAQNEAFRQQQSNANLAQRQYEFDKGLELNQYQIDLKFESQKRAQAWELEKMETRSRLDFEQEESKLRKTNQEFEMGMQTISDSHMTEGQKEEARFELQMRKMSNENMSMPRDPEEMLRQRGRTQQQDIQVRQQGQEQEAKKSFEAANSRIMSDLTEQTITPTEAREQLELVKRLTDAGEEIPEYMFYENGQSPTTLAADAKQTMSVERHEAAQQKQEAATIKEGQITPAEMNAAASFFDDYVSDYKGRGAHVRRTVKGKPKYDKATPEQKGLAEYYRSKLEQVQNNTTAGLAKPKTRAAYDAIPSGDKYRDTDGQVKIKG